MLQHRQLVAVAVDVVINLHGRVLILGYLVCMSFCGRWKLCCRHGLCWPAVWCMIALCTVNTTYPVVGNMLGKLNTAVLSYRSSTTKPIHQHPPSCVGEQTVRASSLTEQQAHRAQAVLHFSARQQHCGPRGTGRRCTQRQIGSCTAGMGCK